MSNREHWNRWVADYQVGQISDEEFAQLEEALRSSPAAREAFHRASRIDSHLRREAENEQANVDSSGEGDVIVSAGGAFQRKRFPGGLAAAAAVVMLSALTWTIAAQKRVVATLLSSENAVWESEALSEPGSPITRGSLRLSSGIATIRLDSGVSITLEAPVRLFLKGSKKASLVFGTVVVDAAEAETFYLETDQGQAVGGGMEYIAVSDRKGDQSEFEILSGSVMVSHDRTREAVQLSSGERASLFSGKLESSKGPMMEEPREQTELGVRIRTNGRAATFIRNNNPWKWTRPEFLTLKKSDAGYGFDQYSVVGFDLSAVEAATMKDATLRLNLVPSGIGLASRLPKVNHFAVYGLLNPAKENWSTSDPWENAPAPADGKLVGRFEIPRSQQTGTIDVSGEAFREFVKQRAGASITLILVRETTNEEGAGHGLVHAIASDVHPEVAGPVLEISLQEH